MVMPKNKKLKVAIIGSGNIGTDLLIRSEERRVGKECVVQRVDLGGRRIIQAEDGIRDAMMRDWSSDVCSSDLCYIQMNR